MIYFLIRHKATGEYMPQLERGRGYSHWNPAAIATTEVFRPRKLLGVPRLLPSRRVAARCIVQWDLNPNSYMGQKSGYDDDLIVEFKDDGRKKEDLEIVEVDIVAKEDWKGQDE